jgi:hypothetical protein
VDFAQFNDVELVCFGVGKGGQWSARHCAMLQKQRMSTNDAKNQRKRAASVFVERSLDVTSLIAEWGENILDSMNDGEY